MAAELAEISKSIRSALGESSGSFRKAANDNNAVIGKLNRDLARYFAAMKSQLSDIAETNNQIEQNTEKLVSKTDRFTSVLSESINIQNQLFNEMRNVVSGIKVLNNGMSQLQNSVSSNIPGTGLLGTLSGILGKISLVEGLLSFGGKSIAAIITGIAGASLVSGELGGGTGAGGAGGQQGNYNAPVKGWWTPEKQKYAVNYLMEHGKFTEYGAAGAVARMTKEAPGGPGSSNTIGGGHWGIAQWGRSRGGQAMANASFDDQLAHYVKESWSTEKAAGDRFRSAKNASEAAYAAASFERAEGWAESGGKSDVLLHHTPVETVYGNVFGSKESKESKPESKDAEPVIKPEKDGHGLVTGAGAHDHGHDGSKERDDARPGNANAPEGKGGGNVIQAQSGTRHLPLNARTLSMLQSAASASGVTVRVTSGAQPNYPQGPRTGSTRHDVGVGAADVDLISNGRVLGNAGKDVEIKKKFVEAAFAAGATGIGAGEGYMGGDKLHVGFGKPAVWGGTRSHDSAYTWLKQAFAARGGSTGGGGGEATPSTGGGGGTGGGGEATPAGGGGGTGGGETPAGAQISEAAVSQLTGGGTLAGIQSAAQMIAGGGTMGGLMGGAGGFIGGLGNLSGMDIGSLSPVLTPMLSGMSENAAMMPNISQTSMNTQELNREAVVKQAQNEINADRASQNALTKAEEDNNLYNANIREGTPTASDYNRPDDKKIALDWMHGIEYRGYREFQPLKYG